MAALKKAEIDSLVKKREKYYARLQALYDVGKKCIQLAQQKQSFNTEFDSFVSRYQRLEDDYSVFEQTSDSISLLNSQVDEGDRVEVHSASMSYDDLYFNVKTIGRKLNIDKHLQQTKTDLSADKQSPVHSPQVARLPKLEIEPFDGTLSAWPNFYALFTSMIHKNQSLSKSEKLTYLRSLLKSHALSLIETLVICDENYDIAMRTLTDRYQNKRLLASNYLDKILSFRPLTEDSTVTLSNFLEIFSANLCALKALGLSNLFDFTMLHIGLRSLTSSSRKEFENEYSDKDLPEFEDLISFVQQQLKILEITTSKGKLKQNRPNTSPKPSSSKSFMLSTVDEKGLTGTAKHHVCPCCQEPNHKIYVCPKFKKLSLSDRNDFVKKHFLCFSCLGFHTISECKSTSKCFKCNGKHHTLLHRPATNATAGPYLSREKSLETKPNDMKERNNHSSSKTCNFADANSASNMMLSTAIIGIRDKNNKLTPVRAIIDGGSQTSLITQECVLKLGLTKHQNKITIKGIADTQVPVNKGSVTCNISPLKDSNISLSTEAVVVPKISSDQPNIDIDPTIISRFDNLQLADPKFYESSPVEFLIGADLYFDIIKESHNIIKGEPSAMNTIFGWIVGGRVATSSCQSECSYFLNCCESVDSTLKRFWEVEAVQNVKYPSPDDIAVESHFTETHIRDKTGRYVVSLPIKPDAPNLPNTRDKAEKRLISLENRLKSKPETYLEYREFMDDYLAQGHMSITSNPSPYVIPHHCVKNENSSTTKLRTVFNASFKPCANSSSLNDIMYSGPKLQRDIGEIITNFRLHEIVVCADIKQMYRQIVVNPTDRAFQHIFYRTNPNGDIDEYELNVLTYGVTSSAYLAQRVLLQLVEDEGKRYPLASQAITHQTFVDDICTSVDSPQEALQLQQELITLLGLGGFTLRKWASNCQQILDSVPLDCRENPLALRSEDDSAVKVLGLQFDPAEDVFFYVIKLNPVVCTKRSMLSEIAKIYDILGWITPTTFYAKHIMQSTWLCGLEWDDPLPDELRSKWTTFISTLSSLSTLKIPRFIPTTPHSTNQIIGFCDASEKGYAANIYIRTETLENISVHLIKAKSKVAPLKTMSIPRLELSAAQLLTEVVLSSTHLTQTVDPQNIILFSDSAIVLMWLKTPPYKLKTFVANRVVNILESTNPKQWHHVTSKENPCDCASRGLTPEELVNFDLWWKGPQFLYTPFDSWSLHRSSEEEVENLPEIRKECLSTTVDNQNSIVLEILEKYSSLSKAKFVIAYVLRFINNVTGNAKGIAKKQGPISPQELEHTLSLCVKTTQQRYLSKDISDMKNNKPCSKKYRSLALFIDENDFVRVGGRLKNANLTYSRKHPFLIPRSSRLATLICDYYHSLALHSGPRLTQSLIQEKFWIVGVRQLLRERIFKCQKCYMFQAKPITPKMADLPSIRFESIRAFQNVGLDYAGPFEFKESNRRKSPRQKGYIVIFVCFSTKAVHIEFATSLSTPSFLAALDRFVARRGLCQSITSDCGTNFQGAANYFSQIQKFLKDNNQDIAHHLASKEIKWNFIPPAAPHFGGLWEAAVKSAKRHLIRAIGTLILTYEEMYTLLTRIEAILNSRPIGAMTTDPNDGDYLSPGHFIVGTPLLSPPEEDFTETKMNRLERYQLLQQAAQSFWKQWSQDYLQTLIPRNKWTTSQPNLQVGDVIYLQNKDSSPLEWPIGRVIETYPGPDATVRAAKVKTPHGTYVRPVHKLVPLPPSDTYS